MTQSSPPRPKVSGTRNLKLLITSISLATTLSGWALIALSQANAAATNDQSTMVDSSAAVSPTDTAPQPQPTDPPTAVPQPTDSPVVVIPPLSSLPVRGLPSVGDPAQQSAPQQLVFVAPQPAANSGGGGGGGGNGGNGGGGGGGGGGGPAVRQAPPAPAPAPAPKPKPVGRGCHGSHC